MEKCAHVIVNIDLVESLPKPENLEVSLRYVLKHANYGDSNIFHLFDTTEKQNHLVARRRRWNLGREDARQESRRNEWYDLGYHRSQGKSSAVLQPALYRLLCLSKARRRPEKRRLLGTEGRIAKAKDCFREPGQEHAEIP